MSSFLRSIGSRAGLKAAGFAAAEDMGDELAFRRAEEAASRRFQAAAWLREMDRGALESLLPEEPTEEEFCLALRNGLILCNVLNKICPGAVPKVVETPIITVQSTDGGAQLAIQYFENMRNFLVSVGEMKLLTFEASDLEKGGSSSKVVDCILCLKGYHEWKLAGGIGIWRYGGIVKITSSTKGFTSCLLDGANTSELHHNSMPLHSHELSEVLLSFTEALLEGSEAANCLKHLYDQFTLQVLQAFLTKLCEPEEFPLNAMLINMVLEKVVKAFCTLLVSRKHQLGLLMKKSIKEDGIPISKTEFIGNILRCLNEVNGDSYRCSKFHSSDGYPNASSEERLDHQEKQLEKLKLLFQDMKVQAEYTQRKWDEEIKQFESSIQGLKVTASSYYKLVEENRLLYNQVQDLKGSIRVHCRVKPFLTTPFDGRSIVDHIGENGDIMIINPHKQGKDARKAFSFNKVFGGTATQNEVFADTQPLIRSVMDGYNVCIFAYGQTGSGKTYTMSGPDIATEETWGVNYRALNDLFDISKSRNSIITYDISVQMIEIYNEQVRDLLVAHGSNRRLDIRNNSQQNGLNIPDASLIPVSCTKDVLDLMKTGQSNRAVGATALNERSSRSHSVLTVHVRGKDIASESILKGCLHLVDLAGSERVDKSEATGERLKEAQHINRSLSALGDVIFALSQKSAHIPYRNSKLTQVLQDALGGQAKTLMFVHMNSDATSFGETLSTLKFAERVATVELGAARANKEAGEVRELKEEISKLKSELENKESELLKLKDHTCHTLEMQTSRMTPPPHLHKHGDSRSLKAKGTAESRKYEQSRSCSSGKHRNPLMQSVLLQKESDAKLPLFAGEGYLNFRSQRSPSPIRRSISTDRATIVKSKPRIERVGEKAMAKLQFSDEKVIHIRRSITKIPSVLQNKSLSECQGPQEQPNSRRVFTDHEEQFSPELGALSAGIKKNKADRMTKPMMNHQSFDMPKPNIDTAKAELQNKADFPETENDCSLVDSPVHGSSWTKKLQHHATRLSHNTELRASIHPLSPPSARKHESRPSNSLIRNRKAGIDESNLRRSRSLPRGRFLLP